MQSKSNKIILGSQSPRRLEILSDAGFDVKVIKPEIEERYPFNLEHSKVAEYISKLKIYDVYSFLGEDDDFILCADTVVIFEKKLLGKPKNKEQAFKFLKAMNGKEHEVITGVSMRKKKKQISFSELTKVKFKELSEDEIRHYIDEFETLDKAAAYNIQEYIGVESIQGDFYNVMGLPIKQVLQEIKQWK
jgi:septum formation protein